MFHYVLSATDAKFPNLRGISERDFSDFLDWIVARGGEVVHPERFLEAARGGKPLPANSHLLTFDDGLNDHYNRVFPELRRRGLSGLFFVTGGSLAGNRLLRVHKIHALYGLKGYPWLRGAFFAAAAGVIDNPEASFADPQAKTAYPYDDAETAGFKYAINYVIPSDKVDAVLDRIIGTTFDEAELARAFYLSGGELEEMANAGMRFGFHGQTHRPFSRLTPAELTAEMNDAASALEPVLSARPQTMSYPYGDASSITDEHVKLLQQWGIDTAFMAESTVPSHDALHLPRTDIAEWQRQVRTTG
jgi:peptidoglycan/xylan/chitin deacetylase (PgdA/CDA1 family)